VPVLYDRLLHVSRKAVTLLLDLLFIAKSPIGSPFFLLLFVLIHASFDVAVTHVSQGIIVFFRCT
jgi:hypothetical protein